MSLGEPEAEKRPNNTIEVKRDIINQPNPESCRFLPLPSKDSESYQNLFELFDMLGEAEDAKIEVDDGLEKMFVLYDLRKNDFRVSGLRDRYDKDELPETDAGVVYDLTRISEEWFTYKYYRRYNDEDGRERWEYLPERQDDFDEERWQKFSEKRREFLDTFLEDIDFENRFFVARGIQIGGHELPIKPDVLVIAGFDRWWIGPTRDPSAESGFSDALYLPENPSVISLAEFVETNGMAVWKVLDESFTKESDCLWSFSYSREEVLNMNAASFFADSRRHMDQMGDDRHLADMALMSKMTAHLAGMWDIARIVRYFKKNDIPELEAAFRSLYESRVDKLMRSVSGEDLLSLVGATPPLGADVISPVGDIPGYEEEKEEKEPIDPQENRLTKNTDVVDISAVFADPHNIQYLLEDTVGTETMSIASFIDGFSRVEFNNEEDLERVILDAAYLPLNSIEKD